MRLFYGCDADINNKEKITSLSFASIKDCFTVTNSELRLLDKFQISRGAANAVGNKLSWAVRNNKDCSLITILTWGGPEAKILTENLETLSKSIPVKVQILDIGLLGLVVESPNGKLKTVYNHYVRGPIETLSSMGDAKRIIRTYNKLLEQGVNPDLLSKHDERKFEIMKVIRELDLVVKKYNITSLDGACDVTTDKLVIPFIRSKRNTYLFRLNDINIEVSDSNDLLTLSENMKYYEFDELVFVTWGQKGAEDSLEYVEGLSKYLPVIKSISVIDISFLSNITNKGSVKSVIGLLSPSCKIKKKKINRLSCLVELIINDGLPSKHLRKLDNQNKAITVLEYLGIKTSNDIFAKVLNCNE